MYLTSLVCLAIVTAVSLSLNAVFSITMLRNRNAKPHTGLIRMKRIRKRRREPEAQRLQCSSSEFDCPIPNGMVERISAEEANGTIERISVEEANGRLKSISVEEVSLTGSGEDEEDVFLARKRPEIS